MVVTAGLIAHWLPLAGLGPPAGLAGSDALASKAHWLVDITMLPLEP